MAFERVTVEELKTIFLKLHNTVGHQAPHDLTATEIVASETVVAEKIHGQAESAGDESDTSYAKGTHTHGTPPASGGNGVGGGAVTYPTLAGLQVDISVDDSRPIAGPYAEFEGTGGSTSYETAFNISGAGELLWLGIQKPSTANSVNVQLQLTIDGVVIASDVVASLTGLGADNSVALAGGYTSDQAGSRQGATGILKFNTSAILEIKWSADPGASEVAKARYWYYVA
jgi:hypothetical protein